MCETDSKKYHIYFLSILLTWLTVYSGISLAASDTAGTAVTVYDGNKKKTVRAESMEIEDILSAAKIRLGPHDTYWIGMDGSGQAAVVSVERAVPVIIKANGKKTKIYTTQQTVQGAVNDAGFDWQTMMPLEDGFTQVKKGMTIHVVPYTRRVRTQEEALPVSFLKWYNPELSAGTSKIVDEGRAGRMAVTVEEYVVDGNVVRSSVLRSELIDEGLAGVMEVGTLEDTVGRVMRMRATAYHPTDGDGRGITATGTRAGYGTVAVDPSVIPLGSTVFIPGYGEALASDTGGAIVGNRIDLCMEEFDACFDFGVRDVDVFISH